MVNGAMIAADQADLTDGSLGNQIDRDPNGNQILNEEVWTGTNEDGTSAGLDCAGWTSADPALSSLGGTTDDEGSEWTNQNDRNCDVSLRRIFCFDVTPPAPAPSLPTVNLLALAVLLVMVGGWILRRRARAF
jgi:hypothetical protein